MTDDQPPLEAYDGLVPTPQQKRDAERESRANDVSHLPPQNLEVEEALLGSMLMSYAAIDASNEVHVEERHFYRPSHRHIFRAIHECRMNGHVDELTVANHLKAMRVPGDNGKQVEALRIVGGHAAIMSLVERVPAVANARAYAREVVATYEKRRAVEIGHEIAEMGYDTSVSPEEQQQRIEALVLETAKDAGRRHAQGEEFTSEQSIARWKEQYAAAEQDRDEYERQTLSWGRPELDERIGRMVRGAIYVPAGWTKHGKALEVSEPVMTPTGWRPIGSLEVGDKVIAVDGKPTTVLGVYPQGERATFRVVTQDGAVVVADGDHLWEIEDRRGVASVVTTRELDPQRRQFLPRIEPVLLPTADLPLHPYIVGALLGDGCVLPGRTDVAFSSNDIQLVARIRELLPAGASIQRRTGRSFDYGISGINPLVDRFRSAGHEKRVPAKYMIGSAAQRLELLRGLLDTDGWVEGLCSIRFCSTSEGLAQDVRQLVLSLGGVATIGSKVGASYEHNGERRKGRPSWIVSISMPHGVRVFALDRKHNRADMRSKPRVRRRIVSVEPAGMAECVCIEVEHERKLFLTRDYVPTHNTWWCLDVIEAVALQGERSLLHSAEMSDKEVTERLVAMGGHDYTGVQEMTIPWPKLRERAEQIESWGDLRKTIQGKTTVARVRSEVVRAALEGRPYRLVVIDHLGLLRPDRGAKFQPRREFVEDAVAELKALAEEYGFTLLLVAQLSRPERDPKAHPRYKRAPFEGDLKDASGIEQIATCVIFVYRIMDKDTGKFVDQDAMLVMPFHRARTTPKALAVRFTLPRDADPSGSYRFRPTASVQSSGQERPVTPSPVQEQLEGNFGPVQVVTPDDVEQIY